MKKIKKVLKKIVRDNVKPQNCKLNLIIYYKSRKTSSLVIRNNCLPRQRPLARTHLVYQFVCPIDGCNHPSHGKSRYVGETTCSLSRRLSYHLQQGSIKDHFEQTHGSKITRAQIVDNTSIRFIENDVFRLKILEALVIKNEFPSINSQDTGLRRILKLYA